MKYIVPKNWRAFQHYKDRSPSWIKLHKQLLDDCDFQCLPVASRALAPMLWLLASEYDDGRIPADTRRIAFRLRMSLEDLSAAFQPLLDACFFEIIDDCEQDASKPLAELERVAIPEKEIQVTSKTQEREEKEGAQQAALPPPKPQKGRRWASEEIIPDDWLEDAALTRERHGLPRIDLRLEAAKFANYWSSITGNRAVKLDWRKTWLNWILEAKEKPNGTGGNRQTGRGIREAAQRALEEIERGKAGESGTGPPGTNATRTGQNPPRIAGPTGNGSANHSAARGPASGVSGAVERGGAEREIPAVLRRSGPLAGTEAGRGVPTIPARAGEILPDAGPAHRTGEG